MERLIKDQLRDFVTENFLFGRTALPSDDASFLEAGIIDSTGILELVTYVEQTYEIIVAPDELVPEYFDSIARLTDFVQWKLGGRAPVCGPEQVENSADATKPSGLVPERNVACV